MAGREFDIIERYFSSRILSTGDHVRLGPGDDCAILSLEPNEELCVSTDTMVGGVHLPEGVSGEVAACRCVAANLSDLAAMGATPVGMTLALTMPDENADFLESLSAALERLAAEYRTPLVGGNLARGPLSITMTVMGTTPAGGALLRSGAAIDDDIYVSGAPGEAAGGLRLLQRGDAGDVLIRRYEAPTPRLALGRALLGVATAAIDVSDGLAADLAHVAGASGCGAALESDLLPVSATLHAQFGEASRSLVLSGGDDYELCFTADPDARPTIEKLAAALSLPLTRIGRMIDGEGVSVRDASGAPVDVAAGYQHFHEA